MLVDISNVRTYIKPLSTTTLLGMKKSELIEYIRTLEHNYNVSVTFNEQQANYMEKLLKEMNPIKNFCVDDKI